MACLLAMTTLIAQEEALDSDAAMRLASMVPLNVPIRNFRLPQFDEDRVPTATITAQEIRRTSDTRFALIGLRIILFTDGKESGEIVTPRARYDLKHKLLVGDQQVKITTAQAVAEGRGFIYDMRSEEESPTSRTWAILSEVTSLFKFEKSKNP